MFFNLRGGYTKIQTRVFFGLLLLFLGICLYMVAPYTAPILWAAVLASIFYPVYSHLLKKLKNKSMASLTTLILVILIVLIPVSLVAVSLTREVVAVVTFLQNPETITSIASFIEQQKESEFFSQYIEGVDISSEIKNVATFLGSFLLSFLKQGSTTILSFFAKTFIMLYALFFFLRDGDRMLLKLEKLLPFGNKNERKVYARFVVTSKATLKGSILLSVAQGLFAGLGFYIVGFPSIIFFIVLSTLLSIIPAVGPSFIFIPSAIYLFATGSLWQALLLLAFSLIISLSENITRPYFVGDGVGMHPVVFFFATIGGISLFGISGIVFGPIMASFLLSLLDIYESQFKKEIDKDATLKIT